MRIATRASLIVAMLLATIGTAGPAQAYSNAFFHTQSQGNRGVDVLAIQYLLQHHGFTTDKDAVFDTSVASAVRGYQSSEGIGFDGIVGPITWRNLIWHYDLWPIRTDSAQCTASRITWRSSTYDRVATRQLVEAIRVTGSGDIKVIWFNDPVLIDEG